MKKQFFKRAFALLTMIIVIVPTFTQLAVSAEESDKYPYNIFGRNGIEINAGNLCINGDAHSNKEAVITANSQNINGKITTGNDIEKRVKHVYADTKIREKYFTENCELYEDGYVKSEMNIHINSPIFSYRNIELDGNVALNSNIGTLMNINVTGEVKNANTSVVYSKYGNITIENDSTANINGLIYAPLGTLTINSPNVSINGIIIADKIIINGNSINLNGNDNIARFIGTESEVYDLHDLICLPKEWLIDTDKDDLFDIYEKVIDSDLNNPDTDGDKLPDGYEVITLDTDPTEIDTDENGISDADEDFDNDNLNNLGEYENKTEPFNPDTDDDGLLDGDEIKKYKTDPLNSDTDDDGLLDGEEGYNGTIYKKNGVYFDPLNPDTNGNGILDGDEVFRQYKKQEVSTYDEAITEINVSMSTNGSLERNLKIESMYGIDAMSSDVFAMIGEPFNFETSTKFNEARITFKIDQSKLGDTEFDNLIILWYNEKEQIFEEMPTTRNKAQSTISTKTTHFSQYIIVDSEKWYANWEASFTELRKMWNGGTTSYKEMNTIFVIDCCSDMETLDSSNQRLNICSNIVNGMMSEDRAAVITYSEYGTRGMTGLTDKNSVLSILSSYIRNSGAKSNLTPAFADAVNIANSSSAEMNRIIILTNGNTQFTLDLGGYNLSNVTVNVVDMGGYTMSEALMNVASVTGGSVYGIASASDLAYQVGDTIYTPPQFIGEDSDGDGIPDLVELYGLKPNGQPINSDPYNKHSDKDGLQDNEELNFSREKMTYDLDKEEYDGSVFVWSDPTLVNSDWDSYDDKKEKELGSNPLVANFYIENEDYEFVLDTKYDNHFLSDSYYTIYYNDPFESGTTWLGNNVFSSNGSKVELYKKAIIDYLDKVLNSRKMEYELQELKEVEKSYFDTLLEEINAAYETLRKSDVLDAYKQKDLELLKEFQASMQRRKADINSTYYPDVQTKEAYYKRIDDARKEYEYYAKEVEILSNKIEMKNMKIKTIDGFMKGLGYTLDFVNASISAKETYDSYVTFKSNINIMEDGIHMLEIFAKSYDVNIKKAALQLLEYANTTYENATYEWDQVKISVGNSATNAAVNVAIANLPKFGSYASLFIIVGQAVTNISEVSLNAEYTVANSMIAQSLCNEIREMAQTGDVLKNGISISNNYKTAAKRFTDLIVLRINAEEKYILFSNSFPFYIKWYGKDGRDKAQKNINKLNEILLKYIVS